MCGFVVVISPAVPVQLQLVERLRDTLAHRGPDAAGAWIHASRRLGMGFRRLAIVDRSAAADQPMITPDKRLTIVFNGEIYNYIELRAELKALGHEFHTSSDTEVLLQAYRAWGRDCLSRLNGMFAFVIHDATTGELFAARDRFGEKPLFLGRGRFGLVVLASEMKAILAHPLVSIDADMDAVGKYGQSAWYEDGEQTFFDHIRRVPPAHAVVLGMDGAVKTQWRYWTPVHGNFLELEPQKAVERFRDLLEASVRTRLRADVPVGSSLSGGLDSSVIVGLLAEQKSASSFRQNTFSACFPEDPTMSEDREIDQVVSHTSVNSYRVVPDGEGLKRESLEMHWHQEEPVLSASIYLQWCVARLAAQNSTTVLLDGQGADELLGGYQSYFKLQQLDLLDRGEHLDAAKQTLRFNRGLEAASGQYQDAGRRFNSKVAYSIDELSDLKRKRPAVYYYPYEVGVPAPLPGMRMRRTMAEALLYNGLPTLLRYADRNSMAFSREARLPYLDYELVDFCLSLPDSLLVRRGWQKWILREAAGLSIPAAIRWRTDKVGYAAPLDRWLRGSLKEWAQDRAFDTRLRDVPGYSMKVMEALWHEHQQGANNSWAIWRWISLAEWFELRDRGWWRAARSVCHV